jgi:hypothetical protein
VGLLSTFPPEIRHIISDGIAYLAEREFEAHLLLNSLKSLGAEKILGIYKSKHKRRNLDEEPVLHKVLNYLFILSPENQLLFARKITELVGYICQYFEICKLNRQEASHDQIMLLTREYVRNGSEDAKRFLVTIQQQFKRSLLNAACGPVNTVGNNTAGMRVKKKP